MTSPPLGVPLHSYPMGDQSHDSSGILLRGFDFLGRTQLSTDGYNREEHTHTLSLSETPFNRILLLTHANKLTLQRYPLAPEGGEPTACTGSHVTVLQRVWL